MVRSRSCSPIPFRSESPPPPPPLPSPPFRSTYHPSDLAVFGGDLMEKLALFEEPLHTRISWYILPWQKRFDRGLPGWDYGSCSVAAPDIDGRGCS
uniref:Uncharacterized protein n=1 Tax=Fagus sylvatica TaxID=28930 RepID=A0A2N9H1W7_FAGSY